jgi:cellulose synthase/poly-beta-1,6-N-acetylglucosamine synthase-like glycosyltransferase
MVITISNIGWMMIALLGTFALAQMIYAWVVFGKLAYLKPKGALKQSEEPVSIIIAARNEYNNLEKNLPAILTQDYPQYEVVVVNHCSWDESQKLLESMQAQYPHLKVSQLIEQEKYPTGKKFALTIGIKAAKYEQMLFTDADCMPASNQWLRLMQQQFGNEKDIVLGFAPYEKHEGLLNLFIRFETLLTAMFYFSAALLRNPFMGVGRNLAYTKTLFFKHKGFASHNHIHSGDDDLFVNETATPNNVAIQIHPDSFVYSSPKTTFEQYTRQKRRHLSTGKLYKKKHKRLLGMYYATHLLFYTALATCLLLDINTWPLVIGIFLLRVAALFSVFYPSALKLNCTMVAWFLPLLDVLYTAYLLTLGLAGFFTRNARFR